ncbi:MAG: SusD/RagB family nutrient-binding outer membrane lipoprotein [Bacteroidota bacterium]
MKKILSIFLVLLVFSSCTKLEDLNKNIKDPPVVPGESLFTAAQKRLFDQMVTPNVNLNIWRMFTQQWTETTYNDESIYDIITRPIPGNHWNQLYVSVLKNLDESGKVLKSTGTKLGDDPAVLVNKLAIIEVLTVYSYSVLVESFGNVPYSQALKTGILLPKYDDGLTIYKDLIARLDTAINKMNPSYGSFGNADNMYYGDVAGWLKFANSLKLRMGMLLSDIEPTLAKTTVEAAAPHVISSNADNARIVYMQFQPNSNPIYDNLVASGRHDFVGANTFIDKMNSLKDPRLPYFFTMADTSTTIGISKMAYVGGVYGDLNDYYQYSHVADKLQDPTFEAVIFDASETEFLLAEGVARGFTVGGTVETHYNNAITLSFQYWSKTDTVPATYLAQTAVKYSTATGTWKQKIGEQKWLALYNRGFEAWTSWRMLDYPVLVKPADAKTDIPLRLTFPVVEQTLNGANYAAASAALGTGGDAVTTRLFWDMFPPNK